MNALRIIITALTCLPMNVFAYGTATSGQATADGIAVTAGDGHTCAISKGVVSCWGRDRDGQTRVPALLHPTQLTAGSNHTCALHDYGVKCWGDDSYKQSTVPPLQHPTAIVAGGYFTCALDDQGVKCWGSTDKGVLVPPPTKRPRQIVAGGFHACVLDDDGVKCWGSTEFNQTTVPSLINPKQISAGGYSSCAIDDDGVKCWGDNRFKQNVPAPLRHVRKVISGGLFNCAIDDSGLQCWGDNGKGQISTPNLSLVKQATAGWSHACAVDASGASCWGNPDDGRGQIPRSFSLKLVEQVKEIIFNFYTLESSYSTLSQFVYRDKKIVLEKLSSEITRFPIDNSDTLVVAFRKGLARLYSLYAIEPLLRETSSQFVTDDVLPHLQSVKDTWSAQFGVRSIDDIEFSKEILDVSFVLIESSLAAAKSHLAEAKRADMEALITKVGQIKGTTTADLMASVRALVAVLDQYQPLMTDLIQDPSTAGFGKTVLEVQGYLKRKE